MGQQLREDARVVSDKATERLFKLFADDPDFRWWLTDTAVRLAYEAPR